LLPTTALEVTFAKINFIAVEVAAGALIVNVMLPEVPPPGTGFVTATLAVPVAAISVAGTSAVIAVDDTNVVVSPAPFHLTVELLTKFVPDKLNVKSGLPAVVELGLIELSVGTGFAAAVTVNVTLFEVPPPGVGFTTVTGNAPVEVTSLAEIVAVSSVEETTVVVAAVPLKSTTEFEMKFVPSTVSVKSGLPAAVDVGLIELNVASSTQ